MSPRRRGNKSKAECCGGIVLDGRIQHEEWCPTHIRGALTWVQRDPASVQVVRNAETAINALVERVGQPVKTLTVSDVVPLARMLYQQDSIGCCLHAAFTAPEMSDDLVRLCQHTAMRRKHGHCHTLTNVLLRLTPGQRTRVAREARRKEKDPVMIPAPEV